MPHVTAFLNQLVGESRKLTQKTFHIFQAWSNGVVPPGGCNSTRIPIYYGQIIIVPSYPPLFFVLAHAPVALWHRQLFKLHMAPI